MAADGRPGRPPRRPARRRRGEDPAFLFVQTFAGVALRPNPGAGTPTADGTPAAGGGGAYLLTLAGHHGETVYFSDRPRRAFGEAPNAALVAETDAWDAVVVLELLDPAYDAAAGTVTYGAEVLAEYAGEGLAHVADQQLGAALPDSFGRASLFIDECTPAMVCRTARCDEQMDCTHGSVPGGPYGYCWSWSDLRCHPCRDYGDLAARCNATYASCTGECKTNADFR